MNPWGKERVFRRRLADELPKWCDAELIDDTTAEELRRRYPVDGDGGRLAAVAIYIFGALLVGGGIISFVAWNWEDMPDAFKLIVIGTAMVGATTFGYRLWAFDPRRARLGHALMLLGMLIFGANIGLVAQIFHVSSVWWHGWLAWCGGTIVAAWLWRSVPIAVLSMVVGTVALFGFVQDFESTHWLASYGIAAGFLPLAWWTRSRVLFTLTTAAFTFLMAIGLWEATNEDAVPIVVTLLSIAAMLLAFAFVVRPSSPRGKFAPVATVLGFLGFGGVFYVTSFHEAAENIQWARLDGDDALLLWPLLPVLASTLVFAAQGVRRGLVVKHLATSVALAGISVYLLAMALPPAEVTVTVAAHLALLSAAIVAIARSVQGLQRWPFWSGIAICGLLIASRFLEFDTELWLKAIAFVVCGVLVIFAGMLFERRLRLQEA